jgi:hypothetical protein
MRRRGHLPLVLLLTAGLPASVASQHAVSGDGPAEPAIRFTAGDHPTLALRGDIAIELRGRFDADLVSLGERADFVGPEWSGRRLGVAVRVGRHVAAEVSRELGADEPWRDVHVTWRVAPWLQVRGGRFKIPFSEERLRSLADQDFLERSLPARALAPGRDAGMAVGGRLAKRRLEWEAGMFEGRGEAWTRRTPLESTPASALVAVRLGGRPFTATTTPWRSLRAAVAMTRGERSAGLTSLAGRTLPDRALFTLPVFVQGREQRLGVDGQWSPGPLRLGAEWMRLSQERRGQGLDGADLPRFVASGWYASAVWRVFHRRGGDRRLAADWMRAVDVGLRVEGTSFDAGVPPALASGPAEAVPPSRHRAVTAGTTWTAHRWIVVQVDVVRERLDDAGVAVFSRASRTSYAARWRVVF